MLLHTSKRKGELSRSWNKLNHSTINEADDGERSKPGLILIRGRKVDRAVSSTLCVTRDSLRDV